MIQRCSKVSGGLLFSLTVMESSPLIMEAEECSSCESGWTMYLSSPMHDGGDSDAELQPNDEEEDDANDRCRNESDDGSEGEDNDSMASDASTGPIQRKHGDTKCDQSSLICRLEHDDDDDGIEEDERNQYHLSYSCKKFCEANKMKSGRRVGVSHKEDGAASFFHTGSKVKKASGFNQKKKKASGK
ncbi:protein SOB FIVE-LIKE 3 isoform X1 [Phoenix dactylifera]|uniref:Protein SOB FIVE-LIKE 3 isoform X1 n=1 Tax=Phoenix dactylifera TaxID=42345 RepID=A0A8B7MSW5_PHODC|nr:protein SOB FIVE-LIKE 3 isoform X1 [Phoenix dactylifera]